MQAIGWLASQIAWEQRLFDLRQRQFVTRRPASAVAAEEHAQAA